jgi:hypothetical protein
MVHRKNHSGTRPGLINISSDNILFMTLIRMFGGFFTSPEVPIIGSGVLNPWIQNQLSFISISTGSPGLPGQSTTVL